MVHQKLEIYSAYQDVVPKITSLPVGDSLEIILHQPFLICHRAEKVGFVWGLVHLLDHSLKLTYVLKAGNKDFFRDPKYDEVVDKSYEWIGVYGGSKIDPYLVQKFIIGHKSHYEPEDITDKLGF